MLVSCNAKVYNLDKDISVPSPVRVNPESCSKKQRGSDVSNQLVASHWAVHKERYDGVNRVVALLTDSDNKEFYLMKDFTYARERITSMTLLWP